jgi:glycosyltransferase involved in cell wall biosynthesis
MACGCPTLVSDAPAMPEVAGDGAIVLPVMDGSRWGETMCFLLSNPEKLNELRERGLRRAACYSWSRTSADTLAIYREVLDERQPLAAEALHE